MVSQETEDQTYRSGGVTAAAVAGEDAVAYIDLERPEPARPRPWQLRGTMTSTDAALILTLIPNHRPPGTVPCLHGDAGDRCWSAADPHEGAFRL